MKIAIWHNLKSGGGNRALQQQMQGLIARGHELTVWSTPEADNRFLDLKETNFKVNIVAWKTAIRIREQILDDFNILFFRKSTMIKNMEAHCQACAFEIEKENFDVLLVHSCNQFLMPYIGRFVKKTKKVLYLHEPNRSLLEAWPQKLVWEAPDETKNWKSIKKDFLEERHKRVLLREERANYFTYDSVLVNSFFSHESVARAYGQRGQVCYLGIDEKDFQFLNSERQPFVMGIGTFYPHKDIETAIRAVGSIDSHKRPALVWVGNDQRGDYFDIVCRLAQDLGVDFRPKQAISQSELTLLLNQAKVFIYTSRLEPFGYAPLEANACGLPVVAVAEGGIRETVVDGVNGLLCNRNPEELGKAISKIIDDEKLFETLSKNGRRIVLEKWSFELSIDRIEQAIGS